MNNVRGRPAKTFPIDALVGALALINSRLGGKGLTAEEIGMSDYLINRPDSLVGKGLVSQDKRPPAAGSKGRPCKVYILTDAGAEFLFQNKELVKVEPTPAAANQNVPVAAHKAA